MNVKELEELVLSLQKKLDRATVEISRLKAENAMLKEKLAKYESRRRNNSKNTSQPPSRDQKSEPAETEPVEGNGKTVSHITDDNHPTVLLEAKEGTKERPSQKKRFKH